MSILIKGMNMPKDCGHCLLCEQDTIYDALVYRCLVTDNYLDDGYEHQIMKDCPLVPVPPHGRLIDADALADVFRGFIAMYDSCPFSPLAPTDKARRDELQAALAEVINAPTIIPAEEGE